MYAEDEFKILKQVECILFHWLGNPDSETAIRHVFQVFLLSVL